MTEMRLNLQNIQKILQQEINWCLDHPDNELNLDQQMGFMNGLRQAEYLIRMAENIMLDEHQLISYLHDHNRLLIYAKPAKDME